VRPFSYDMLPGAWSEFRAFLSRAFALGHAAATLRAVPPSLWSRATRRGDQVGLR